MSKDEINAFLGAGTVYEGKLSFQGAVRVDGIFSGQMDSEGSLIVGKDAAIDGTLRVGELMLSGRFVGDVYAKKRVLIHRGGVLEGTIYSPSLIMEDGGILQGQVNMQNLAEAQK
ncbi:MAG: polymer-forming cytoskeletal protein [Desulfovibrionaceae bacterium]